MSDTLEFEGLEQVYDWLATAIDEAGPENEALFLSKLCLTLAHNIEDLSVIENAIHIAQQDL